MPRCMCLGSPSFVRPRAFAAGMADAASAIRSEQGSEIACDYVGQSHSALTQALAAPRRKCASVLAIREPFFG